MEEMIMKEIIEKYILKIMMEGKEWIYINRKYNSLYNYYIIDIHIKYILRMPLIIKLNYF